MKTAVFCLVMLSIFILHGADEDVLKSWNSDIIYFIVTDRFNNGDSGNDGDSNPGHIRAYHGGDLKGIIQKLDYLQQLGVTALWITPVMDNRDGMFYDGAGYHGYWIKDFYRIDEHLGTLNDLQNLSKELHRRKMKLILDIVVNHSDWDAGFREKGYTHARGNIENWDDQDELENGDIYGMPDFAQEKPEVYEFLLTMTKYWIDSTDCDGIRFDAVKHVGHAFWKQYLTDLKEYLKNRKPGFLFLGEVLHGDPHYIVKYLKDGFTCVFDFPMFYHFEKVFGKSTGTWAMADEMKKDRLYRFPELMSPFLDNHDVKRFVSRVKNNPEKRMKLALAALFSFRGIPMLYYGTEVPLYGDNEDESRKDMIFDSKKQKFHEYIKHLTKMRKTLPALTDTGYQKVWHVDDDILSYYRISRSDETLVLFNVSEKHQKLWVELPLESYSRNLKYITDYLSGQNCYIHRGKLYVKLAPLSAVIIPVHCPTGYHEQHVRENIVRPDYSAEEKLVTVTFSVETASGDHIVITGSHDIVGNWNPSVAPQLEEKDGVYSVTIQLPTQTDIEYKYVVIGKDGAPQWESGGNRILKITDNIQKDSETELIKSADAYILKGVFRK